MKGQLPTHTQRDFKLEETEIQKKKRQLVVPTTSLPFSETHPSSKARACKDDQILLENKWAVFVFFKNLELCV